MLLLPLLLPLLLIDLAFRVILLALAEFVGLDVLAALAALSTRQH